MKIALRWKIATLGGEEWADQRRTRKYRSAEAGRIAIEHEDIARESLRWQRRKQTIERFKRN